MAATPHDPHNLRELASVIALGVRIERRRALGKSTKALEQRVDRIREQAQKREDQRGKGRKQ
ncbi:hypothetical protein [Streptomyces sp. NPDC004658]|uniref:hypothetical protein n=1 Tax=Streptomyces sp. NPDC004658 TaxID=3154672 RepID=UPI0033BA680B